MIDLIENRKGIWWPANEKICYRHTLSQLDIPETVMSYVSSFNTVVQAGGNAGWYAKLYSDKFKQVYVFEPDHLNFLCLTLNNPGSNVVKMQACLGAEHSNVCVSVENNRGTNHIVESSFDGDKIANIPVLVIDELSLQSCDLIHLDVEGYEYFVLLGAKNTILKYKPIIAFEHNGSHSRYNISESDIFNLLDNLGYVKIDEHREDLIFGPK